MTSQKVPAERLGPLLGTGRTAEVYDWDDGHVLKLFHTTMPFASVAAEARSAQIVTAAGLPVPAAVDPLVEVDGRFGIIFARLDGPTMLALLANEPQWLEELAGQFGALHAQMHRHTCRELPSQREALARAIDYAPALPDHLRERALHRLDRLPGGAAICHGDFHPDNIVMTAQGPVIIDWMTATSGNPAADVARTMLLFRTADAPESNPVRAATLEQARHHFYATYRRAYAEQVHLTAAETDAWLPVVAAARLAEQIAGEEDRLLSIVETL
ncbi:MAG: phosphotransferase [Caldilinea sp.]|nr:phosphotransferase [Caldilinea sp.]MCB0150170.1 phosphotransferase [Caldilineaceae bacterium]MCB9113417.1 phosphotransferase [Caldilineaceae bacterium]MCB9124276.1 phosphotransferase [Caldilineaceae bacterium]MCO5210900.1 phosphotransferase [Caldilinea sp.]